MKKLTIALVVLLAVLTLCSCSLVIQSVGKIISTVADSKDQEDWQNGDSDFFMTNVPATAEDFWPAEIDVFFPVFDYGTCNYDDITIMTFERNITYTIEFVGVTKENLLDYKEN